MQTIGILVRIDRRQQRLFGQSLRQGQLQQDAVDRRVGVEAPDQGQHLLGRGVRRQMAAMAADADAATGLFLVGDIDAAGGIVPDPQHRQAWCPSRHLQAVADHGAQAPFDRRRQSPAVEKGGHGENALPPSSMHRQPPDGATFCIG